MFDFEIQAVYIVLISKFHRQNGDSWAAVGIGNMSGVFTQSSSLPSANGLTFAGWNQDHGKHLADITA